MLRTDFAKLHFLVRSWTVRVQDSSRPTSIKDKVNLGPLLSRISPVLKRRSPAHSPPRDAAHGADAADATDPVAAGAATGEDATPNGRASAATGSVASYAEKEAEVQQLRSDRAALEKQLVKAREEVDRTSELVKDMEHKWTEVAKDYEKQVRLHPVFATRFLNAFPNYVHKLRVFYCSFP